MNVINRTDCSRFQINLVVDKHDLFRACDGVINWYSPLSDISDSEHLLYFTGKCN